MISRRRFGVLLGASSLAVASPALAHPVIVGRYREIPFGIDPAHPHPISRGDRRRTGRMRGAVPAERPSLVWQVDLRSRTPRGPILSADGTLFIGTRDGLSAVTATGEVRWHLRLGHVYAAPTLMPGGDVVAVTAEGRVSVLSQDGVVLRGADVHAGTRGSPLVLDDGSIIVPTIDRRIHRLDANLREVSSSMVPDGSNRNDVSLVGRDTLAVASGRSLVLLGPRGRVLHQVTLTGSATSAPLVADDGTLFVTTVEGVLHAIDPRGRVTSRTELGSRHYDAACPVIGRDGGVRIPTLAAGLVCVGPSGTVRWSAANANGYQAAASIDVHDVTLLVDRGGEVRAIGPDGTERWSIGLETFTYEAPVVAPDGTLYVTTERGGVRAYRA
ncbi:MAG: PQQ-binding-like beta-propeller repeat protein [Sandaracinaceae bacterium]